MDKPNLRIKEVIKQHNLTVNEVADRLNITRFSLSTHINGNPSAAILLKIANAIGCQVSEFFGEEPKDAATIICPHCGKPIKIKAE